MEYESIDIIGSKNRGLEIEAINWNGEREIREHKPNME